jgi:hypothetical protein
VGSNCTTLIGHPGPCNAAGINGTSNPDTVTIYPGSYLGFTWSEADTGPAVTQAGQIDVFDSILGVAWVFDNGASTAVDVGSLAGRCDSVYSSTTGCVDEKFYPIMVLSRAYDFESLARRRAVPAVVMMCADLDLHGAVADGSGSTRETCWR